MVLLHCVQLQLAKGKRKEKSEGNEKKKGKSLLHMFGNKERRKGEKKREKYVYLREK